jgi:O-antigen ligase
VAIHIIASHPIMGVGTGNYYLWQNQFTGSELANYHPRNLEPKSLYLALGTELGCSGLLAFGLLIYRYTLFVVHFERTSVMAANKGLIIGINAALIALLLAGIVDTPVLYSDRMPSTILTVILLAMICKFVERYPSSQISSDNLLA